VRGAGQATLSGSGGGMPRGSFAFIGSPARSASHVSTQSSTCPAVSARKEYSRVSVVMENSSISVEYNLTPVTWPQKKLLLSSEGSR